LATPPLPEGFLEHTARTYAAPLPKYVVDTFEDDLLCGDLSRGFLRASALGRIDPGLLARSGPPPPQADARREK
jgi:hypothetical protein